MYLFFASSIFSFLKTYFCIQLLLLFMCFTILTLLLKMLERDEVVSDHLRGTGA